MYTVEMYQNHERFNKQYNEIYEFLLKAADRGYNELFHWGRFEWMMGHSLLDTSHLDSIALFRDEEHKIAGLIVYDTFYEDRYYILHLCNDPMLLKLMVDLILSNTKDECTIKISDQDHSLCQLLQELHFVKCNKETSILEINLDQELDYKLPFGYSMSPKEFLFDHWKYQMVIHKGFNHTDIPDKWDEKLFTPSPNSNTQLSVFAIRSDDYCAHCQVWYSKGDTAYIEPVVTIPECRNSGLGKAVVYEALSRARGLGAKRAIVLSEQEFYFKIGFKVSSDFYSWRRANPYS